MAFEYVFYYGGMENTAPRLAEQLIAARRQQMTAEAEQVRILCELAIAYRVDEDSDLHPALCDETVLIGGDGTPLVSEFLSLEVAALLGCTTARATGLIAQALNLRFRHPSLYGAVIALEVEAGRALTAASNCAQLPFKVAELATNQWIPIQGRFGHTASLNRLDEIIAQVAPELVAEREQALLDDRSVRLGRYRDGSMHLIAQLDVLDAKYLDAAADQMADLIAEHDPEAGHGDLPRSVRRAKGLAALAHPAYALALQQRAAQQALLDSGVEQLPSESVSEPAGASRPDAHGCLGHACGTITTPLHRLRPAATVYVHIRLAQGGKRGCAWVEQAGVITRETIGELLGDKQVTVRPIIDLNDQPPESQYRPSVVMREAVDQVFPSEAFPFATRWSRGAKIQIDHTVAYRTAGPPGQTGIGNLAPLSPRVHRAKTAAHWRVDQPRPGVLHWTSPLGYRYQVGPSGTVRLS